MRRFTLPQFPMLNCARFFHKKKQLHSFSKSTFINTYFFYGRGSYEVKFNGGRLMISGKDVTDLLPDNIKRASHFDMVIDRDKLLLNGHDITSLAIEAHNLPAARHKTILK